MKKFLLFLFVFSALNLFSCEYDKTREIRAFFGVEQCHRGTLEFNGETHGAVLSLYEDAVVSLRFTEGPLKGLEKIFEGETERHRYEDAEFMLPAPSEYALIPEATKFLSCQHYVYQAPKENADRIVFSFSNGDVKYTVETDISASALLSLTINTPKHRIVFNFLNTEKDAYGTSDHFTEAQNLGRN